MEISSIIENNVARYFNIKSVHIEEKELYFKVHDYDREKFVHLVDDLDKIGYLPFIDKYEDHYRIDIAQKHEHGKSKTYINVILFFVTVASTVFAGYLLGGNIVDGIAFSMAIMAIIGTHETAHYFAAKKHGIKTTLPYFIPAPTLIGTFGAVIKVKSAIPHKNALFDLGYSGPLAGIIVTIPVLVIGIHLSNVAPVQDAVFQFMPSILMYIPMSIAFPSVPNGYGIMLHPVAFAAWVGIIITMLNLMPVAFLDGGHISRSIFSEKIHGIISFIGIGITLFLGWMFMAILMGVMFFMSKKHPGALDNVSKLSGNRKKLAILMIIIFILCLSQVPAI
ncbi:MAG: site-2 protease family protein [Methanobacteriaceae archaeon]|jgi:membrane-associated protease RseP (regulator of RpoE activity)